MRMLFLFVLSAGVLMATAAYQARLVASEDVAAFGHAPARIGVEPLQ